MPRCTVAFQNCTNLFPAGLVQRAPATPADVRAKVLALANSLSSTVGRPQILSLCEVHSQPLADSLVMGMGLSSHTLLFRPSPTPNETGLAIAYDPGSLRVVPGSETTDVDRLPGNRRPRWFAVLFELIAGNRGTFWLVVNHWKSQMGGQLATDADRQESAFLLGDFFLSDARVQTEAMLLMGDFNCEPGDRPFYLQSQRLLRGKSKPNAIRCVRELGLVLRDRNRLAHFYNLMWRFMAEPATLQQSLAPGFVPDPAHHLGTHGPALNAAGRQPGWVMFDQVMVSKRLLTGGVVTIEEDSLRIHQPHGAAADHAAISVTLGN